MRGDSTPYSTVLLCACGARVQATVVEQAYELLLSHQRRAGCDSHSAGAALAARRSRT